MECPKCGRKVDDGAFICPACEFILDTSFLGDDITDDERAIRKRNEQKKDSAGKGVDFGEDAMILGSVDDEEFSDFRSRDAGVSQREVTQARFYIGGVTAQLLNPDAVPEVVPSAFSGSIRMTPFERHVLEFINGKRSIGRIQKKSGMEESEFKTSIAMLGDKGIIRLRTMKKKKKGASLLQGSVSEHRAVADRSMASAFEAGDRTVVAPAPESPAAEPKARGGGAFAEDASATELALPQRDRSARSVAEGTATRAADGDRFRSLRADSEVDSAEAGARGDDAWGSGSAPMNSSNVFARAKAGKKKSKKKEPSLVDREPDRAHARSDEGSSLSESVRARLRPPAGEEPQPVPEAPSFLPGVPPEDDDDLLFAPDAPSDETRELPPSARHAPVAPPAAPPAAPPTAPPDAPPDAPADDDDEFDGPTGPRRPLATSNTATRERPPARAEDALPDRGRVYDEHTEARDVTSAPTGPLPPSREEPESSDEEGTPLRGVEPPRAAADDAEARGVEHSVEEGGEHGVDSADIEESHAADDAEREEAAGDARRDDSDDGAPAIEEDDGAEGFEVELHTAAASSVSKQHTASLPQSLPELPSDALLPLPSQRSQPAVIAMPGQPLVPPQGPPAQAPPPLPTQAPPPLPGQALMRGPATSGAPPQPATTAQPAGGRPALAKPGVVAGAARPSAQSTVPFEQARKAEKIFEQAQKDHAAGRLSSARMNAKLATQFDPSVPAYKEFLAMLDEAAAGQKPGAVKPREVMLFEQASDAEGRGDYRKAVQLLKQALEINTKAAALYNRLGVVLSIRLKEHNEALGYLKKAIELEPGSLVYMNNFSKVTAALESQLERDPEEKKRRNAADKDNKVEIKKIRPKMF